MFGAPLQTCINHIQSKAFAHPDGKRVIVQTTFAKAYRVEPETKETAQDWFKRFGINMMSNAELFDLQGLKKELSIKYSIGMEVQLKSGLLTLTLFKEQNLVMQPIPAAPPIK
jgi:hypothetical protein